MEMDLHDEDGKKADKKEKMVTKGFEPSNNATEMKISYSGPILGRKKKVDDLNSSKDDLEQIKKIRKQE